MNAITGAARAVSGKGKQSEVDRQDLILSAIQRAYGIGQGISFMCETEFENSLRRAEVFKNAVQELADALVEAMSPAMDASLQSLHRARDEVSS